MPIEKVLVVGGGLAGMTLATALARKGVQAEIIEISQQWSALGVGISVQGPTLRALRTIGALDACVEGGFGYSSVITCDAAGNVTGRVELPKLNGPDYPATLGIMRPILNDILIQGVEAAGVPVGFGVTVQSIEQEADQVAVKLTDSSRGRYDLIVGADGANSKMRELLFGPASRPELTGQAVWRATVPRPPEVRARYSFYGPRNKCGFNPVSQSEMMSISWRTWAPSDAAIRAFRMRSSWRSCTSNSKISAAWSPRRASTFRIQRGSCIGRLGRCSCPRPGTRGGSC